MCLVLEIRVEVLDLLLISGKSGYTQARHYA